jgi:hypothetical protein
MTTGILTWLERADSQIGRCPTCDDYTWRGRCPSCELENWEHQQDQQKEQP